MGEPRYGAVGARSTYADPTLPSERITLRNYIRLWRRYRWLMMTVVFLVTGISAVRVLFLTPKTYMAKATILPSGGQGSSGFLGLIASFTGGPPAMGGGGEESSSTLFPRILESREIGVAVLQAKYAFQMDGVPTETTLLAFLKSENMDEGLLALDAIRAIDVDKETGLLTVSVTTPYADLSAQIANHSVDALEEFNKQMRRTSATNNNSFVRERLEESLGELTAAEDQLARFRDGNRRSIDADLDLERLRLEREVALKSQVYVTLSNQAELARIEEAKNLPVVRILDRAAVPERPQPVPLVATVVGGGILGGVLALLAVAGLEFRQHLREELRAA